MKRVSMLRCYFALALAENIAEPSALDKAFVAFD
jgi:hypothetical protein